jgi:ribonuclease BN (tRNA processing enzyme)
LVAVLHEAPVRFLCLVHLSEECADDRSGLQQKMEELLPQIADVMIPEDGAVIDF